MGVLYREQITLLRGLKKVFYFCLGDTEVEYILFVYPWEWQAPVSAHSVTVSDATNPLKTRVANSPPSEPGWGALRGSVYV